MTAEERAELDALRAQVAAVEALAEKMSNENGQSWNSISARRIRAALASPAPADQPSDERCPHGQTAGHFYLDLPHVPHSSWCPGPADRLVVEHEAATEERCPHGKAGPHWYDAPDPVFSVVPRTCPGPVPSRGQQEASE